MKKAILTMLTLSFLTIEFSSQAEARHYRGHHHRPGHVHVHDEGALASTTAFLYALTLTDLTNSMNRKEIAEAVLKDAEVYNLTGALGLILSEGVKNLQLENDKLSEEDAVLELVELASKEIL